MGQVWIGLDMDGTIYDCSEIIGEAFHQGIKEYISKNSMDVHMPTKEEILSHVGQPMDLFFKGVFPAVDDNQLSKIKKLCMSQLIKFVLRDLGKLYPEVETVLSELTGKGYKLFVASNGSSEYIKAILDTYNLSSYFETPLLSIDLENINSKSDILSQYKMNILVEDHMFMIGDRTSDLNAARDNEVPFIGCAFGHAGDSELKGADVIVNEFDEIPMAIKYLHQRV